MEFTFDVTQTPIIGRRYLQSQASASNTISSTASTAAASTTTSTECTSITVADGGGTSAGMSSLTAAIAGIPGMMHVSPRRSSVAPYDASGGAPSVGALTAAVPWRRPWQSQARVRECLVNLLNTCGQKVGLPKSPSVIFSQSSELERQSSMASSTEEVSGGAGAAEDRTPVDDITSSENQFAVFKDFDFLEYELESQGEESVDNFNLWGVRRRSPTNSTALPVDPPAPQPSKQQPPAPSSPPSPPSPPPEPDWWDEDGSVSPVDDASLPSNTDASSEPGPGGGSGVGGGGGPPPFPPDDGVDDGGGESAALHPPNKLILTAASARRPPSRSSMSDESSEGDLGELTPCNAPSSLIFPTRPPTQPLHTSWRSHLAALTQQHIAALPPPAYSCAIFSALFAECVSKTCSAVGEAAPLLGQLGSTTTALVGHLEAVACVSPLPYVYLDALFLVSCSVQTKVRAAFIALHEHTDTFLDKLDTALMVVDALKGSSLKVSVLSDSEESTASRGCSDEQQVEVCRALYRLHFQVSLMYDTYSKMLLLLLHSARHAQVTDHSVELSALRGKLVAAAEQLDATPPCTPPPCTPVSPTHQQYPHTARDLPEGEECETDSVGETDGYSLEEDVGESTSSLISSYHPPPPHHHPTTLPTPTHSSTSTYQPASLATPTLSTSSTLPLLTTPTHSTASTLPTIPTLPQANHKVLQLVANQKWRSVVRYSDENSSVWQQPGMPHHNIDTVLNIYCTYLAEKQPGMIAVCCTESYLTETSQHLADANLAALSLLRQMESEQQQLTQSSQPQHSSVGAQQLSAQHSALYSSSAAAPFSSHSLFGSASAPTLPLQQSSSMLLLHSPTSSQNSATLQSVYCHPSSQSQQQPLSPRLAPTSPSGSLHHGGNPLSSLFSPHQSPSPQQPLSPQQLLSPQHPHSPQQTLSPQQPLSPQQVLSPQQPLSPEQPLSPQEPLSPQQRLSPQQPQSPQLPLSPQLPFSPHEEGSPQHSSSPQQPSSPEHLPLQPECSPLTSQASGDEAEATEAISSPDQSALTGEPPQQAPHTPRRSTQC